MGVKSTTYLTRARAETKFEDLWREIEDRDRGGASRVLAEFLRDRDVAFSILKGINDDDLARLLEYMNDEESDLRNGGRLGGFDNYIIQESEEA